MDIYHTIPIATLTGSENIMCYVNDLLDFTRECPL